MIMVVKEFTFDSAHYLPNYDGPCSRLHGHTYRLQIGIKGGTDSKSGMVMDFVELKRIVRDYLDVLDHHCLNEVTSFDFPYQNPTAERMVTWLSLCLLHHFVDPEMPNLEFIRLYETPTSYAEWRKS